MVVVAVIELSYVVVSTRLGGFVVSCAVSVAVAVAVLRP